MEVVQWVTNTISWLQVHLPRSGKVFAACGLWLIALGVYFLVFRPALLPEDQRFIGSSLESIRAAVPGSSGGSVTCSTYWADS